MKHRVQMHVGTLIAEPAVCIELAFTLDVREKLVDRHPLDVGRDVQRLEHVRQRHSFAFPLRAPNADIERRLEPIREPSVGQQLLRLGVVLLDVGRVVGIRRIARGEWDRHFDAMPEQRELDELILVDRVAYGLADLHVVEWRLAQVHDQRIPALGRDFVDDDVGIALELVHQLERHLPHHVDLAILQRGHAGCGLRNLLQQQLIEVRQPRPPVVWILGEQCVVALDDLFEHERAGAARLLRDLVEPIRRQNRRLARRQWREQLRIRKLQCHFDRVGVGRFDRFDHRQRRAQHRACRRIEHTFDGHDHVVGAERFPVVDFHPRLQFERPGLQILGGFPGRCQLWLERQILIKEHERVVYAERDHVLVARDLLGRIELTRRARVGDAQRTARFGLACCRGSANARRLDGCRDRWRHCWRGGSGGRGRRLGGRRSRLRRRRRGRGGGWRC